MHKPSLLTKPLHLCAVGWYYLSWIQNIFCNIYKKKNEGVENESVEQVAFADRILLNKTDLVSAEELNNVKVEIAKINNRVDMIECQHSKVDPKLLIGIKAFDLQRCLEIEPNFLEDEEHSHGHGHSHSHIHNHVHDNSVSSIGFKFSDCDFHSVLQQFIKANDQPRKRLVPL